MLAIHRLRLDCPPLVMIESRLLRMDYVIMRPTQFHPEPLAQLVRRKNIATMPQLKQALGTSSDATVFRKLKELSYLTSYTHSGRYYTLEQIPSFDDQGLWSFRGVGFSRYGTLLSTVEAFIGRSEAGWHENELAAVLQVSVKEALLGLVRRGRVAREKVGGRYLYGVADQRARKKQVLSRKHLEIEATFGTLARSGESMSDELKAAIVLFFTLLNEKQRRLFAGLESLKLGYGGDRAVAEVLDLDVGTVAQGRLDLIERDVALDRVRRSGAGRKPLEKKRRKSSKRSKT